MNIPTPEYEQHRSVFQLCDWISSKLRDLEKTSGFEERYFERKGKILRGCLKKLFLLPIWACPFGVLGAVYGLPV